MSRGKLLREIVADLYGVEAAKKVWGRLEVIGDIAILRKPPDLNIEFFKPVAEMLLKKLPYVKSVWLAISPIKSEHRVREYVHLAGEPRSETIYKEHGCLFKIDILNVYISPTLSYEHIRIAKLVMKNENIINMFAGAGLFSIIIAKHAKPTKILSIDINPRAYALMLENVKINKVEDVVQPVLGDAAEVVKAYRGWADRVLMPLPELSYKYLSEAVEALKAKGFIHVYDFVTAENPTEALRLGSLKFSSKLSELGVKASINHGRVVRSVGPKYYQIVLDIEIVKDEIK